MSIFEAFHIVVKNNSLDLEFRVVRQDYTFGQTSGFDGGVKLVCLDLVWLGSRAALRLSQPKACDSPSSGNGLSTQGKTGIAQNSSSRLKLIPERSVNGP